MGETFPEGTSESDPSAVPPFDPDTLEDDEAESGDSVEDEPENQQTG